MALYQYNFTFSTVAQFLTDIATFADGNGWTVNTLSSTLCVVTKGAVTWTIEYSSGTSIKMKSGASGYAYMTMNPGDAYAFVSCGASLFIGRSVSGIWVWGGLANISTKVGAWAGGIGVCGFSSSPFQTSAITFDVNGVWSPASGAGAVWISTNDDLYMMDKQPFTYNAGILPAQVMAFALHTDTSLYRPLGYIDGLYRFRAGDIYVMGEELVIGADTYLAMPMGSSGLSSSAQARDLLFKLGA